jgi:hypothetical protein
LVAQVDLLRSLSLAAIAARSTRTLPVGLEYLPDVALYAVDEPDGLIGNHLGYALAAWLELAENDPRIDPAIATLERFSTDPRTGVRQSAAYGAARLKDLARESMVRNRMAPVFEKLSTDPTARVRRQAEIGVEGAKLHTSKPAKE